MFIGKNVTLSSVRSYESAVTIDAAVADDLAAGLSHVGVICHAKDNVGYLATFPRSSALYEP